MSQEPVTYKERLIAVRQLDKDGFVAPYRIAAEALVKDYPKRGTAWLELGISQLQLACYEEALTSFRHSSRLCTTKFRGFPTSYIGRTYQAKGNLKLAEKWHRKALAFDERNTEFWAFLGSNLARQGRFSDAKEAWRRQIKIGTGATDEGHLNLALIYRAEGRYKLALRNLDKAIALDPKYKEAIKVRKDVLKAIASDI